MNKRFNKRFQDLSNFNIIEFPTWFPSPNPQIANSSYDETSEMYGLLNQIQNYNKDNRNTIMDTTTKKNNMQRAPENIPRKLYRKRYPSRKSYRISQKTSTQALKHCTMKKGKISHTVK